MEWAINLWQKNKVLFFIAIPVILLFVFKDVIIAVLASGAREMSEKARKEDAKLKAEADKLNNEANKLKDDAKRIGDNIGSRTNDDIPDDWHTR